MTAPVTASEQDVHTLPASLLNELKDQIGCDSVLFEGFGSLRQRNWFAQSLPADDYTGILPITQPGQRGAHFPSVISQPGHGEPRVTACGTLGP